MAVLSTKKDIHESQWGGCKVEMRHWAETKLRQKTFRYTEQDSDCR